MNPNEKVDARGKRDMNQKVQTGVDTSEKLHSCEETVCHDGNPTDIVASRSDYGWCAN